jgi:lipid-A-disaccharide synthase
MMTIFPFEEQLYREAGLAADFVGHTMVRDIPEHVDKESLRVELGIAESAHAVALVPGSRPAEIRRLLPVMCEAALIFLARYPDATFMLPLAGEHLAGLIQEILAAFPLSVKVYAADAARVMAAADSGLVTSGTATLQAALVRMPHVLVYKVDRFTWWLGSKVLKPLVMSKDMHLGIANVLAIKAESEGGPLRDLSDAGLSILCHECGRPLFVPELLQHNATPEKMAHWLIRFRTDDTLRSASIRGYAQIRRILSPRVDCQSAASIVMSMLDTNARTNIPIV